MRHLSTVSNKQQLEELMKTVLTNYLGISFLSATVLAAEPIIKVNSTGYLPKQKKMAWVNDIDASVHKSWKVISTSDNATVLTGTLPSSGIDDEATAEVVYPIDFTALQKTGEYTLSINGLDASYPFEISDTVYNSVFETTLKSYYYVRSGMDLKENFAGEWARQASHMEDGYVYEGYSGGSIVQGDNVASTGGWYDAGDYGKKIIPAAYALFHFFKLREYGSGNIEKATVNIPNENNIPDYLAEAKYELNWFLTMQRNDGAVHHLITSENFFFDMPHKDTQTRYLVPVSATATADFAAVMAMAAKAYKPFLPDYAETCLAAAEKAWDYLAANPEIFPEGGYKDPEGINNTGAYDDESDKDERLWAAAELFNTTGQEKYQDYFDTHYTEWAPQYPVYVSSWREVQNLAFFTYVLSKQENKSSEVVNKLSTAIGNYANSIVDLANETGYGIAMAPSMYYWGSTTLAMTRGVELILANEISPKSVYMDMAHNHLNYALGANSLNQCFVSGIGENAIVNSYLYYNDFDTDIPGLVTGGPNQHFDQYDHPMNAHAKGKDLPPAKCFIDHDRSYSTNESAVNQTGVLLFLSGWFYGDGSISPVLTHTNQLSRQSVATNIGRRSIQLEANSPILSASLYTVSGKEISSVSGSKRKLKIPTTEVANGHYILKANLGNSMFYDTILISK